MKSVFNITDSEWIIMEVVWNSEKLSASEIVHEVAKNETWNDKTIRTLIKRLVDKKVIGVKKEHVNQYYPLVSKEYCVKKETNNFIKKMYNGSIGLLVSNFVKDEGLTSEDINVLKKLLEDSDNNK